MRSAARGPGLDAAPVSQVSMPGDPIRRWGVVSLGNVRRIAHAVPGPHRHAAVELNVVRDASGQLPSSLRLKAVLSVFVGALLLAMTFTVLVGAGTFGQLDPALRGRLYRRHPAGRGGGHRGDAAVRAPLLRPGAALRRGPRCKAAQPHHHPGAAGGGADRGPARDRTPSCARPSTRTATCSASSWTPPAGRAWPRWRRPVLHNVGNVLNSVNVSAGVVIEAVQQSRVAALSRHRRADPGPRGATGPTSSPPTTRAASCPPTSAAWPRRAPRSGGPSWTS